jgi:SAM-dependent methyltransferase
MAMPIEQSRDPKQFADFELAGWESNIAGYDAAFGAVARQTVEAMLDAARVTNGRRVLDVCCGPGMLADGASKRGADATGLDFSVQAIELASRLAPKARFQQGNAQSIPFPNASFDLVLCGYGVMHLPDPEAVLREFGRNRWPPIVEGLVAAAKRRNAPQRGLLTRRRSIGMSKVVYTSTLPHCDSPPASSTPLEDEKCRRNFPDVP